MNLDDDICVCHHVSLRKLMNFAKRERPKVGSQMADCLGAGTGCGWCIPILCRIAESPRSGEPLELDWTPAEYLEARRAYHKKTRFDPDR